MKLSVIVPNFNCKRYLSDALSSIQNQTYKDWECIIVDDCSTDKSDLIAEKFCTEDNRFILLKQTEHYGASHSRNIGLNAAKGEWVLFLDADDVFVPDAFEIFLSAAETTGADIVETGTLFVDENAKYNPGGYSIADREAEIKTYTNIDPIVKDFYVKFDNAFKMPWVWRRMWHRTVISDVRFDVNVQNQNEDFLFVLDSYYKAKKIAVLTTPIIFHRLRDNSTSHARWNSSQLSRYHLVLDHMDKALCNYSTEFKHWCYVNFISGIVADILEALRTPRYTYNIAKSLAAAKKHPAWPKKDMKLKQKILISLFITVFNTGY